MSRVRSHCKRHVRIYLRGFISLVSSVSETGEKEKRRDYKKNVRVLEIVQISAVRRLDGHGPGRIT